jgi:hypothetical protein
MYSFFVDVLLASCKETNTAPFFLVHFSLGMGRKSNLELFLSKSRIACVQVMQETSVGSFLHKDWNEEA